MGIKTDARYATQIFAGIIGGNYVFNFRYWGYESSVVDEFEATQIELFTSDKANLIAPIKSVLVTTNDGTEYYIVKDGNISLQGYDPIKLSSGAKYGAGQENAVEIPDEAEIAQIAEDTAPPANIPLPPGTVVEEQET